MNRKMYKCIILFLIIIESFSLFLMFKSYNNFDNKVDNKINENIVEKKNFSMFVETSNGKYIEYNNDKFPTSGYVLNQNKTICTDNRGVEVKDIITVNNNKITINSGKTTFCYLYFDLI